jgi:hypothetical protein
MSIPQHPVEFDLSASVASWPASAHSPDSARLIEFTCPVCAWDAAEVTYWAKSNSLSVPCGCNPSEVVKALMEGSQAPPGTAQAPDADASFEAAVQAESRRLRVRDEALRRRAEELAAEHASEWFGVTLEDFDPGPEPVPCVLEFAPGRRAFAPGVRILFGKRGTLKSWLELEAVRQEIHRGNRALMIDYEMSQDKVGRRLLTLGASREELARFVYVQGGPVSDLARANLARRFADEPPTVVVLDSIGLSMAAAGYSTNDDTETGEWYTAVPKWMSRQWPDAVILLIDHVPKGSESARDPIGSQRKGAFSDGLFLVTKEDKISKTTRGRGSVMLTKDRDGDGEEESPLFDFEFGGGGPLTLSLPDPGTVTLDAGKDGLSDDDGPEMLRIARYVGEREGVKVDPARGDLGISANDFDRLKNALAVLGVIEHKKRIGLFKGPGWAGYVSPATASPTS